MYSYLEYTDNKNEAFETYDLNGYQMKYKIGEWVCFDHGSYPKHFSKDPFKISGHSYQFGGKPIPIGRPNHTAGSHHDEQCLRYAHQDEIDYYVSEFPTLYNNEKKDYDRIYHMNQNDFIIGDFDSRNLSLMSGKDLILFLLKTYNHGKLELLSAEGKKILTKLYDKMI